MLEKKINLFEYNQALRVREDISKKIKEDRLEDEVSHFIEWYNERVMAAEKINITEVSLNELKDWEEKNINGKNVIAHSSNDFFQIIGLRMSNTDTREVGNGWDQPIIKQIGLDGGILGLLISFEANYPKILIEAKFEPGNFNKIQISPTLQATFANINKKHGGRQPRFVDVFLNPDQYDARVLLDQYMSEDGGRLYKKRNKGMIIEISENYSLTIKDNFCWLSLYQLKSLIKINSWVNPHVRSLISHL